LPANNDIDPEILGVIERFQRGVPTSSSQPSQMAVAYTISDATGNVLTKQIRPLESARVDLSLPAEAQGELKVAAQLVNANGVALTTPKTAVLSLANTAAAPEATANQVKLSVTEIVNVREGPGTGFAVLGQVLPGEAYDVIGKTPSADWWQIDYGDGIGWVIASLASTNGSEDAIAVAESIPEAPAVVAAPAPAEDTGGGDEVAAAAAAPVVAAAGGGSFGYGVQVHVVDNGQIFQVLDSMGGMGFNWLKQQIEWKRFESAGPGQIDWGAMDEIVNSAGGRGVNVLFSIVKAPAWARESGFDGSVEGPAADPQAYANFVAAVSGRYCGKSLKAIEVWNEQNLHYEWGNKPLNAGEYVQMLAAAYNAIKGACPSMLVISGALTPAGNNPPYAMDDFTYLEEMFKAGANSYLDGVGAHPSGYNVPPSVTWEGACETIQKTGNTFNGACDSPHHSWSFRSTMEGYRNIMNVYGASNKLVWPTEFGWAAGGAYHPAYKYADDNDFTEQAQWTVEAYQMMRNWGWVGPAFLWNLNFRVVANRTELAQWGIVDPSWKPLPVYTALAQMAK
ncbi:MAG: SH3 domain-containing protein, partial [Caldilineaceae bacterium]|nr:SH3 domain-containing protein [Caldilineaceae bacterium]